MNRLILLVFLGTLVSQSAQAQIIGNINTSISADLLSSGSVETGFGFAALRYEDKLRLKNLRERYLELNPQKRGVVTVYDVDDEMPEIDTEPTSPNEANAASGDSAE